MVAARSTLISPAVDAAIANAITMAERILSKIDNRWPAKQQ
jgi:hypothetical protein